MKELKIVFTLVFWIVCSKLFATHNRAGEITYTQVGNSPLTLEFTLTTYTNIGSSITADRCQMEFIFSDLDTVLSNRINGPGGTGLCQPPATDGEIILNPTGGQGGIKKNIYKCIHTFAGPGEFKVWVLDENRNDGIINIPGSVNIPFYVETTVILSPFLGPNTGAILYNPPIDNACVCKRFVHNPNAIDPDSLDSLSYALGACKGANGNNIVGYSIPQGVTLNPISGDFVWECPTPQGEFNFVILIISWRGGDPIDTITRDMQVTVDGSCTNNPPVLNLQDICVDAGTFLDLPVSASDPDNHNITLTATGAIFSNNPNPANFPQGITGPSPITGNFTWQTTCNDVRKKPYQVSFKAEDVPTSTNDPSLVDIKTIKITVVSPPPTNLNVTPQGTAITVNWTPTVCSEAEGYKIYRRNGPSGFVPSQCQTGVPSSTGYSLIATVTGSGTNSFIDDNNGQGLIHGVDYCYMICAYFSDEAESYASNEDCTTLKKDVPIITHVTVDTTAVQGKNTIIWSPARRSEIDTITFPGPYKYLLYFSNGANCNTLTLIDSIGNVNLPGTQNDTIYQHINVDTYNNSKSYRIEFYNENPRKYIGSSHCASSVYLDIVPSDNMLTLDWTSNVPWTEDSFAVYRQNPTTLLFDSIGFSTIAQYTDIDLINGTTYCYKVKSFGHYSEPGIIKPLINFSQEACGVPYDNVKPCVPELAITPNCDSILNTLTWNNPNLTCADDVVQYKIYFSTNDSANFNLIATIDGAGNLNFTHNNNNISIAGCYYITSLDSNANESLTSDTVCADNCPEYQLPNVFTPNGDGINDVFKPFPYKYIESIDMQIYNRWGNLIFSTKDPEILWNGTNQQSKQPCTDGVYYYICNYTAIKLQGNVTESLHGFVQLYANPPSNGGK
jgi:gliding motility-associated-like protein